MKGAMDKQHRKELRALQEACEEHLAEAAHKIKQAIYIYKIYIRYIYRIKQAIYIYEIRSSRRTAPTRTPSPSPRRTRSSRPPTPS